MSVNIREDNDVIIYEIDKNANTFEVEMARKGLKKKNQILGLIRDGDDLFTCSYPVQTMYEINMNDNNYTVSSSKDVTKIRTFEKEDDLTYENIIALEYKNRDYQVTKYIHFIRTTIEATSFSYIDGGNMPMEEAKEIIKSGLEKIKSIPGFDSYVDMDKITSFFKELNVYNKTY